MKHFTINRFLFGLCFVVGVFGLQAQTPQYSTGITSNSGNTIPWSYNSGGCRGQQLYPVGTFGSPPTNHQIVRVYWAFTTSYTGSKNFSQLQISLKQDNISSLTSTYETGMTQVFSSTSATINYVGGQWWSLDLQTPFPYDPSLPLIWEVNQLQNGYSTLASCVLSPVPSGAYRNWSAGYNATAPSGSGAYGISFGFDLEPQFHVPNDAGVVSIDAPTSVPCGGGTANVVATIKNHGSNAILPVTVNWSLNGVLQTPVIHSTMLDTINGFGPNTAQVTLGSANFTSSTDIVVWTSNPNNMTDTVNGNDSASLFLSPPMNGVYTIDPLGTANNNFANFVDAAQALQDFGVCGPVTFYAKSGTYVGSVNLKNIAGVGAANPLTFTVDSNNTTPVKLEFNTAGNSTERGGFRIENLSYVTVDGYEMEHTINNSYCDVLEIRNAVDHITIKNCYIHRPYYTSSLANPIYFYTSGYIASDVTIENNVIEGGYYGMYLYGNSSSRMKNIVIENNSFIDAYYYGMICYYTEAPRIVNNEYKVIGALSTTSSYGMALYYSDSALVTNNMIHSSNYGMYVYYVNEAKFYNNKVMIGDTSLNIISGTYPLYLYYSTNNEFIHNAFVSQSNSGYMLYFNTGTFGTKMYNNIIAKIGSGSGSYFSSPLAASEMDYNAYELDSSVTNGIDYTMSLGLDTNSYIVNSSIYTNLDSLYTCSADLPARGLYLPQVSVDYDGLTRSMDRPTVGPHEYLAPGSPVLGDDFLLCGSNPVQFIVPVVSSASYLWSTGDTTNTLMVTAPGTYGITVTGLSCGSGILQDEVVIGDAASIADYSTERFWKTVKFTNMSINGKSYMWDFGDGQTSSEEHPNHLYDQNGMYNVCLTTYGDCDTATTCDSILAHNSVGINDLSGSALVSVYPNPAKDQITIVADGIKGNILSIEISNVAGQVVLERQLNDFNGYRKESLNVDRLVSGVYLVKVYTSEFSSTQRLVVGK